MSGVKIFVCLFVFYVHKSLKIGCFCVCVLIFQLQPVMALFINGCTRDHANTISITVFSLVCVCVSVCAGV